jgi:hypothetical protein
MKYVVFWILFVVIVVGLHFIYNRIISKRVDDVDAPALIHVHRLVVPEPEQGVVSVSSYERGISYMRGDRPDGRAAYDCFVDAIRKEHNPDAVLMIAELYRVGIYHSVNPDKVVAARIYQTILDYASKFPRHITQTARQRQQETMDVLMRNERDTDVSDRASTLPRSFPFELARMLTGFADVSVPNRWERVEVPRVDVRTHAVNHLHGTALYDDVATTLVTLRPGETIEQGAVRDLYVAELLYPPVRPVGTRPAEIEDIARLQVQVNNDAQNVHSTTVLNCVSKMLQESASVPRVSFDAAADRVLDAALRTQCDLTKVQRVLSSLNDERHSRFDKSDREVFEIVVSKIESEPDEAKRNNLLEVMCHQLESAVENGSVVCSTGRIVRIVSVYDGMSDDKVLIIPEWALDQELANMALRVRESVMSKASEEERAAYESGQSNELAEKMTFQFTHEAESVYRDIVSPESLRLKIEVYREGF